MSRDLLRSVEMDNREAWKRVHAIAASLGCGGNVGSSGSGVVSGGPLEAGLGSKVHGKDVASPRSVDIGNQAGASRPAAKISEGLEVCPLGEDAVWCEGQVSEKGENKDLGGITDIQRDIEREQMNIVKAQLLGVSRANLIPEEGSKLLQDDNA